MRVTIESVLAMRPCYLEDELRALYPKGECDHATLAADERIPRWNRLWVLLRLMTDAQVKEWVEAPRGDAGTHVLADAYARADAYAHARAAYARADAWQECLDIALRVLAGSNPAQED